MCLEAPLLSLTYPPCFLALSVKWSSYFSPFLWNHAFWCITVNKNRKLKDDWLHEHHQTMPISHRALLKYVIAPTHFLLRKLCRRIFFVVVTISLRKENVMRPTLPISISNPTDFCWYFTLFWSNNSFIVCR